MSGYVSPPPPHPLGQHRPKIEEIRKRRRMDEAGFPLPRETDERVKPAADAANDEDAD